MGGGGEGGVGGALLHFSASIKLVYAAEKSESCVCKLQPFACIFIHVQDGRDMVTGWLNW